MRNISEAAEFEKHTRITDKLYIRALFNYTRYALYDEQAVQTPEYSQIWASLLVLQEIYQQSIAAIYEATGSFPLAGQVIFGLDKPCVIEEISYTVFLDAVLVNFDCKEDIDLDSVSTE